MERSMRPAPPEQQRAMEFKRWFFQDDTARWLSQANRFLLLATFVLLMLLAFVWLRWW